MTTILRGALALSGAAAALIWTLMLRTTASSAPLMCRSAFSVRECEAITQSFAAQPEEQDSRINEGVRRTNHWDAQKVMLRAGELDWIGERIVACAKLVGLDGRSQSAHSFRASVDFSLMHEFRRGDFFDLHVDTTPGDGTGRTLNANVMLSDPSRDFAGGGFRLGATTLRVAQGDLYIYPSSYPHAVESVTAGRRRTLVVAVLDPATVAEPDAQARLVAQDWHAMQGRRGDARYAEPLRAAYWRDATANLDALAESALGGEPRLHGIRERHRIAMDGSAAAPLPGRAPAPLYRAPAAAPPSRAARPFT